MKPLLIILISIILSSPVFSQHVIIARRRASGGGGGNDPLTYTFSQSQKTTGTASGATVTLTLNPALHDVVIALGGCANTGTPTVVDNAGNSYSVKTASLGSAVGSQTFVFASVLLDAPSNADKQIILTCPGGGSNATVFSAVDVTPNTTGATYDISNSGGTASSVTSVTTPSLSTTYAQEFCTFYELPAGSTSSINSPWTGIGADGDFGEAAYNLSSANPSVPAATISSGKYDSVHLCVY
jgi:hypothetical protein